MQAAFSPSDETTDSISAALAAALVSRISLEPVIMIGNIDEHVKPAVPVPDDQPQSNGGQDRFGEGKDKLEKNPESAGAVNQAALFNFFRKRLKKVSHDYQIVGTDKTGEDHGGIGIQESQILDKQIIGNQTAGEKHGEHYEECPEGAVGEETLAEDIRTHGCKEQLQNGSDAGANQRVFIPQPDIAVANHPGIIVQRGLSWVKQQSAARGDIAWGQAEIHEMPECDHNGGAQQNQQQINDSPAEGEFLLCHIKALLTRCLHR